MFLVCSFLTVAGHWQIAAMEWEKGNGFQSAKVQPLPGKPGFTRIAAPQTGITFTNWLPQSRFTTNQIYLNGSGVAAGDFDNDGWCDLFFAGLGGRSVLYRNLGDWKFQDGTETAGLACRDLDATGAAFADLDGDRNLDLIVNSIRSGVRIWMNDGKGRFASLPEPLNLNRGGTSMALGDIDGDGDLDLYVVNYRTTTLRDMPYTRFRGKNRDGIMVIETVNGRPVTDPDLTNRFTIGPTGGVMEHGEPDVLFVNDGRGRFKPVSFTEGSFLDEDGKPLTAPPFDWGLSVMFRDLNGDAAPDIYVCNDFNSPDRIWINNGKGTFRALPRLALRHTSLFSMGADFADLNHDGFDEWFTADMLSRDHARRQMQMGDFTPEALKIGQIDNRPQYMHNMLFFNRGDGTFSEIGHFSRLQASEWSWSPIFLDVDLDGHEDILITTGHERDTMNADMMRHIERQKSSRKLSASDVLNLNNLFPRLAVPNIAFRNRGDFTFEDASAAWGFDAPGVSQGFALADLDHDGDLDVAVNNLNAEAGIYRNNSPAARIAVRLRGKPPNTHGIGARIRVFGGPVFQSQEIICGGRYVSSDDAMRMFAAASTSRLRIEVAWRNGTRSVVADALPNHVYEIDEIDEIRTNPGNAQRSTLNAQRSTGGTTDNGQRTTDNEQSQISNLKFQIRFADASDLLNHQHAEEAFDDFARQPLLSRKLSQQGPGVAWHDLDSDGRDDLVITSGRGGQLAIFQGKENGTFALRKSAIATTRDPTAVLGLDSLLIAGSSNYEDGATNNPAVLLHRPDTGLTQALAGSIGTSSSALALADIDADGDLDLFVGGGAVAGRYPEATPSLLLRNDAANWEVVQRFGEIGLVNGAVFSDLNGDGRPELVIACEWGPVRVLRQEKGTFSDMTDSVELGRFKGWWNGVNTGDLDGDGDLDIIASNWGLNSRYQATIEHPRRIYYGDFVGSGGIDLIEAIFEPSLRKEVPDRSLKALASVLPFIEERAGTFERFGRMSIQELFGETLRSARHLEVGTLETAVFWNEGSRFVRRSLPAEAQWSPAFGVCVGDADGDGNEDVFLSQNFFAVQPEVTRQDSGRGLWLRGDGQGTLAPMLTVQTGIEVYGEQRGCALSDFDADGRVDLVIAQNGASTKLYRNIGAEPGLRVRLRGSKGNPRGVGSAIRLLYGEQAGPIREIHAGSGYRSQDSAVQVLGMRTRPTSIWVRRPGGGVTISRLPDNASDIEIDPNGELRVVR